MPFDLSTSGTRPSITERVSFPFSLTDLPTVGDDTLDSFYIPVCFKNSAGSAFAVTTVNFSSGSATFTPSAGDLAKLRVGDRVASLASSGTVLVPAPSTYTRPCDTFVGLNFIRVTGVSSLPKTGEVVTGAGIPASTSVTRVDVANRIAFLNNNTTEGTVAASPATITFQPIARVLTINTSTGLVTLSHNFAGSSSAVGATINFQPATFQGTAYLLEVIHTRANDVLTAQVKAYPQTGLLAFDNGNGADAVILASVSPQVVGGTFINTDTYFTNARVVRT